MRRWVLGGVVVAGTLCGALVGALASSGRGGPGAPVSPPPVATGAASERQAAEETLVVWTAGGLPAGAAAALGGIEDVVSVTVVHGDLVELARTERADGSTVDGPDDGWVVPLDALALDPPSYDAIVPVASKKAIGALADDEVVLGETSARLRGIGAGGALVLADGGRYRVADVVADQVVGGAEAVFTIVGGAAAGVERPRFALLVHQGARATVEAAIHEALPGAVRVRGPAETPFLRHGDAVLTQAQVKERFGEFAYRHRPDGTLELEPGWVDAHLVTVDLPLVGRATCHRAVVDALAAALGSLEHEGLGTLVDPTAFGGCWNPRPIAPGEAPSRHAWGVAVDLEVTKHPSGLGSVLDPRVVEALERAGFTWGGRWLVPDAAHFEVRSFPDPT